MQYVTNGKHTYGVATDIQLSSFLSNGFEIVKEKPIETTEIIVNIQNEEIKAEPEETTTIYTKTDINRMNVDSLKELAVKSGLEVGVDESGASLKKRLIELLVR